ncbi:FG-GAP-like repeat-containing protein [Dyadobacter sp. CY312]|uniref:FG-GAP-like repeat-containing protein n=1 Tax=Dyadobacter sp. CY312 TaxID=2907303 RepID=UPI001F25520E|nr:FG-GAP-like repeat-containing protein [Dyadobacter sp. CY312]MCE7041214.1 T9SS type A sorting domain-containing protein [Dyadobacter sp. CY312]
MRTKYTSCLFFFVYISLSTAVFGQQSWFKRDSSITVSAKGIRLLNPWAGGLNASQVLKMHLNNDDIEDLVVFDRTNSRVTTFIASPDPAKKAYLHAPAYEAAFPKMDNWMILADYNGDGLKDLFTSTSLGIKVYRQIKTGNVWSWKLEREVINTQGYSSVINLQVSGPDIPGIVDIDGDGDLDIVTFDFAGEFIELHQNMSMEKFGVPDSLGGPTAPVFARNGDCWGNFHKGTNEDFVFNVPCGVSDFSGGSVKHAGNSILLRDLNGDGKKDLVIGHVSNEHLSFLNNATGGLASEFNSFNNAYPAKDPVSFHIFPTAFMEDVDFDGVDDLIVAPGVASNDGNMVDFKSSNLLYHNAGTSDNPDFRLTQNNFLQNEMIDVGENASPSFFDVDGDGDLDMVIGTGGMPGTVGFKGGFWLLTNTGTKSEPAYEVSSENYLDLAASFGLYNIKPQWADFNGDGVTDLGFFGTSSSTLRPEYRYIPNNGAKGAAVQLNVSEAVLLTMPTETQLGDSPFFYDADGDGDLDLIVGKPQGNIHFYTNTGNNRQFAFKLESDAFAGVGLSFEGRFAHAVATDVDLDGQPDLLTVDHTGNIRIFYKAAWGKWTERVSQLVELNRKPSAMFLGRYLALAVGDYNGDGKPDIAVGNNGGGLSLFTNILPVTITGTEPPLEINVKAYPNPTKEYIKVISSRKATLRIVNVSGTPIMSGINLQPNTEKEIITSSWLPGLYILELQNGQQKVVKKVVVQ